MSATPAKEVAAAARDVVERVLSGASTLPRRAGVDPILASLREVAEALGRLGQSRADELDHLDRHDRVIAALGAARALLDEAAAPPPPTDEDADRALLERAGARLPPRPERRSSSLAAELARSLGGVLTAITGARSGAAEALVHAQDRLLRAAPAPGVAALPPFRAGVGVPALHHVEGAVGPILPRAGEDDEDDAPPRDERALLGAGSEAAQLARLARDAMDDIALNGHLRTVPEGMPWSAALGPFDQRLIDNVDALLSLARVPDGAPSPAPAIRVLDELQRWAADAPVPDPARAFAQALVLGSVDGDDAARAAVVGLAVAHPSLLSAQRDALALAPSPWIGPALRRLAGAGDPLRVAIALDVLRLRREAEYAGVVLLLDHPDVRVREAAARCLPEAEPRGGVVTALAQALSTEEDERVALSLCRSLTLAGDAAGVSHARAKIAEELEAPGSLSRAGRLGFLRLVGVAGAASDAEVLRRSLARHPDEAAALGWHGHPGHVEPLLAALEADERAPISPWRVALCAALRRVTGGPPEGADAPTFPASAFRAFWARKQGDLAKVQRYRFGAPYTPRLTLGELERDGVLIEVREELAFELALASGEPILFVQDWVARQRVELARLRERVTERLPGEWPGARLGRASP